MTTIYELKKNALLPMNAITQLAAYCGPEELKAFPEQTQCKVFGIIGFLNTIITMFSLVIRKFTLFLIQFQ